jgi:hypothetical protein
MVQLAHGRDWSLGPKRRPIRTAIGQLSKAADTLRLLRLNWVGAAAQIELDCDRAIKLMALETDLRRACLASKRPA